MKTSEKREKNIEELTEALEELEIAQSKVNKVLERIKKENDYDTRKTIEDRKTTRHLEDRKSEDDNEQNRIPGTIFKVGDKVRITNTKFGQKNSGIITGYNQTRTYQWIWIQPSSGPQIKRIAKNLIKF